MIAIVFGMVLPWLLIALGTWLGYQLVRQNGRILLRLESIEERLRPARRGAAAGGRRPAGRHRRRRTSSCRTSRGYAAGSPTSVARPCCSSSSIRAAGTAPRWPPTWPPCRRTEATGGPIPVVVTTGDPEENRRLVERHGIRCVVLLQEQMEVASQFRAQGTPMGYRIDGAGRIASELTVGAEPLLKLASTAAGRRDEPAASANGHAANGGKGDPSLARSRLNREGLKAGAAGARIPAAADRRGRPGAGGFPRRARAAGVLRSRVRPLRRAGAPPAGVHIRRPDLQVLVVSRRDVEANRAKAAALGLTFPIVLQRQWEISLQYAMFATPIAYLIDERGVLLSDVAVGVGPILAPRRRTGPGTRRRRRAVGIREGESSGDLRTTPTIGRDRDAFLTDPRQ